MRKQANAASLSERPGIPWAARWAPAFAGAPAFLIRFAHKKSWVAGAEGVSLRCAKRMSMSGGHAKASERREFERAAGDPVGCTMGPRLRGGTRFSNSLRSQEKLGGWGGRD